MNVRIVTSGGELSAERAREAADALDEALRAVTEAALTADDMAEYAADLAAGRSVGDDKDAG